MSSTDAPQHGESHIGFAPSKVDQAELTLRMAFAMDAEESAAAKVKHAVDKSPHSPEPPAAVEHFEDDDGEETHKRTKHEHVLYAHGYMKTACVAFVIVCVISYVHDARIFQFSSAHDIAWKLAATTAGALAPAFVAVLLPVSYSSIRRRYYDIMMALGILMCLAMHVHAGCRATLSGSSLLFLSPGHLITTLTVFTLFNSWLGFRPWRILYVTRRDAVCIHACSIHVYACGVMQVYGFSCIPSGCRGATCACNTL
jgi:hypothetical protein